MLGPMTEHGMVSTDEREALLGFLDHQRQGRLRNALYGLTEHQARQAPSASALSVAGLIKHSAAVERNWVGLIRREHQGADFATHMASFQAVELVAAVEGWPENGFIKPWRGPAED